MRAKRAFMLLHLCGLTCALPVPTYGSLARSKLFDSTSSSAAVLGNLLSKALEPPSNTIAKLLDMLAPLSAASKSPSAQTKAFNSNKVADATGSGAAAAAALSEVNDDRNTIVIPVIASVDQNGVATARALNGIEIPNRATPGGSKPVAVQAQQPQPQPQPVPSRVPATKASFSPVPQKAVPPANAVGIDGILASATAPSSVDDGDDGDDAAGALQTAGPINAPSTPNVAAGAPSLADVAASNGFAIVPVKAGDVTGIAFIPMSSGNTQSSASSTQSAPLTVGLAAQPKALIGNATAKAAEGPNVGTPQTGSQSPTTLENGSRVLNKTPLGSGHMGTGVSDARRQGAVNPVGSLKDSNDLIETGIPAAIPSSAAARRNNVFGDPASTSNVIVDGNTGAMFDDGSPFVTVVGSNNGLLGSQGVSPNIFPANGNAQPGLAGFSNPLAATDQFSGSGGQVLDPTSNGFTNGISQSGVGLPAGQTGSGSSNPGLSNQPFASSQTNNPALANGNQIAGQAATSSSIIPGQPIIPVGQNGFNTGLFA
ncbi:hypothetical protein BCR37DRAFT_228255 [Protomyces lactucae-debilis]|uniref:Uncharacterized protein n=1 Tax=Protomyces lactucae-debilis TaxID=2754530 RepID=A0A1Y2EQN6_PROLT|nr:uncharacterized protein BCR37DRAFT_228255 [Protomyces lactucae-debilis]ORY73901.1 hypothetical protein BCR37DRAFT_228255 [Protomyces lactucae-debilis]